jgi:hypothetical protein
VVADDRDPFYTPFHKPAPPPKRIPGELLWTLCKGNRTELRESAWLIASHLTDGKADRTRPLCPYPQVAKYKGTGSIDDAASFACVAPSR